MSRLLIVSVSLLATAIVLIGCNGEAADTHPDQPVTKRRALFKEFTRTLEPMGLVARGYQTYKPGDFLIQALELKRLSTLPWQLFTADSNYPPTKASPEVWQKTDEFKQAQQQYLRVVDELTQAAASSDLDRIKDSVSNVQKSCKSCHDSFRKAGLQ